MEHVYKCVVTWDKYGTPITCTFTLSNHFLEVDTYSNEAYLDPDGTETFYIEADSDEDIQIQWYFEDELLPGETGYSLIKGQ